MVLREVAVGLAASLLLILIPGCARGTPINAPTVVFVEGVTSDPALATSGESEVGGASWRSKEEVEVEWHGAWFQAVVLEKRGGNRWLVHYVGYGDDWDEIVGVERIRERRAQVQESTVEEEDTPDP